MIEDAKMANNAAIVVNLEKLEQVVRKVVRQELFRLVRGKAEADAIEKNSPIYKDLLEISRRKKQGRLKLHSRAKVFGG
jgi:hypothetical protein